MDGETARGAKTVINTTDDVVFHRDAARVLREQAKYNENKGKPRWALNYRRQAQWHEIEANRMDDTCSIQNKLEETALLFARECRIQGMEVGFWRENGDQVIRINHPFLGPLVWHLRFSEKPNWLENLQDKPEEISEVEMYDRINRYLRPIEDA